MYKKKEKERACVAWRFILLMLAIMNWLVTSGNELAQSPSIKVCQRILPEVLWLRSGRCSVKDVRVEYTMEDRLQQSRTGGTDGTIDRLGTGFVWKQKVAGFDRDAFVYLSIIRHLLSTFIMRRLSERSVSGYDTEVENSSAPILGYLLRTLLDRDSEQIPGWEDSCLTGMVTQGYRWNGYWCCGVYRWNGECVAVTTVDAEERVDGTVYESSNDIALRLGVIVFQKKKYARRRNRLLTPRKRR